MNENGGLIFMGLCLFLPMLIPIFIGTPEAEVRYVETKIATVQKKRKKIKPQCDFKYDTIKVQARPKRIEEKRIEIDLMPEAIECLVSLGMKKSLAKEKVKTMWENKKYIDIESFLIDAYRL